MFISNTKIFYFAKIVCLYYFLTSQCFAGDKLTINHIEKFVKQAKEHALNVGKDQALKDFMDSDNKQFRDGSLYIFAQDYNGINLAHIKPSIVGANMMGLKDQDGIKFIEEMTEIAKNNANGGWVKYIWQNPLTKKPEIKHTFAIKVDDTYWIAAGVYDSELQK